MFGIGTQELVILGSASIVVVIVVSTMMLIKNKMASRNFRIIGGFIFMIIGFSIYLWARSHSPNMGFAELMTKMDSYILNQPFYNIIIIIAAIFCLGGILSIITGLISSSNTMSKPPSSISFCSNCGQKISSEDVFCSNCGHSLK